MKLFKGRFSKVFSLVMVAIFVLSNTAAYAQVFTDVPDSHWASEYIAKMNKAGIITGYGDATFKPDTDVPYSHAVVMISRLLGIGQDEAKRLKTKYKITMDKIGVEDWAQEGVAIALEYNIITEDVLKSFYQNGNAKTAEKLTITVMLTKAMGLESEVKKIQDRNLWSLAFTDIQFIDRNAQPYLVVMIDKGVIDKKGDEAGRFNPKTSMNRAMMAKVLSVAYDYMQDNNVNPVEIKDEETFTATGTISKIIKTSDEAYITIEDKRGTTVGYKIDRYSIIKLDGKTASIDDIVEGLTVEIKATKDYYAVSLLAESINEEYSGEIKSLVMSVPAMLTIEYKEDEDDKDTREKAFYIAGDAEVKIDGEKAFVHSLKKGDLVDIKVINSKIIEIDAESKEKTIEGTIKDVEFDPEPVLIIEDEDGEKYTFNVDKKAKIKRNKKSAEITDLRIGDSVEIEVEYNVIKDIYAKVEKFETRGTVKAILISDKPEITIVNKDKEEETYAVGRDVEIEIDRAKSINGLYDLRLGYYVYLDIEGNEIISMDIRPTSSSDRYSGTIEYIDTKANVIVIKTIDPITGQNVSQRIDITDDTTFVDEDGDSTRLRYIDEGDEIIVIGQKNSIIFTAKTIIVLRSN